MDSLVRFSEINQSKPFDFNLTLSNQKVAELIKRLDLLSIKKVSLVGILSPLGVDIWSLKAELRATVKQKCVISLKPVKTIVCETINRTFSPAALQNTFEVDDDGSSPVIFDDTLQELNEYIDLAEIIFEELILILPLYPKIEGAELGSYSVTEPGAKPLNEENIKPFAQLSELKDKLSKKK
tara:strand:- start:669 stop:1214 length:546 start_codon:yes stop_codon:yes gene_type:complete